MFPTRVHHALLIVTDVALHEGPVRLSEIAERQGLHPKSIEMFAQMLRQAGLLASVRGCRGGYILAKPAKEITIGQIARAHQRPSLVHPPKTLPSLTVGDLLERTGLA